MPMLASDVNNPEFVNPTNPDSVLSVQFYMKDPVLKWASEIAGKEIRKGSKIPFVKIMRPGDNTSIIDVAVRDEHKVRFSRQWLAFQIKEGMVEGSQIPGWPIGEWDELKDKEEQVHELKYLRFETVEQLAGASDQQIQRLGIGGLGLRERARQAIKKRHENQFKGEMEAKDRLIADLSARLEKLEAAAVQKPETLHLPRPGKDR